MIGYHYTTKTNWEKIKKEGLKRYLINKRELTEFYPDGIKGIWCWKNKLTGDSHIGSILWQVANKKETTIVKLKIKYKNKDILNLYTYNLYHSGMIGDWVYHNNESACILNKDVHLNDIELVKEYDLKKLLK